MIFGKDNQIINKLFSNNIELLPSVTEVFELELAFLEYNSLPKEQFIERTAYSKSYNNELSKHYLLYANKSEALSKSRSALTQSYFENGQFSTGYATHGLFPYRGKFHPQLIKGLLNIINVKKSETVLDPMAGSGTTNIEAALMGINSTAIEVSPFCQFMIEAKYNALNIDIDLLKQLKINSEKLFTFFSQKGILRKINKIEKEKKKIYQLAFLAFLDALGYSKRVEKSTHSQLFKKVLNRYIETVINLLNNPYYKKNGLGNITILDDSDALNIKLNDNSVDAVITSPPYSFAIDYAENDREQLEFLGYDINELKKHFIGLKGKTKADKLKQYFLDMDKLCSEVSRVLKKEKYFLLIIGSNTNQTGGIRLEETIINSSNKYQMPLVKSILKPIKGMRNTMKDEYILIFQRQ